MIRESKFNQRIELKADSNAYGTRILTLEMTLLSDMTSLVRGSRMLSTVSSDINEDELIVSVVTGTEWQHLLNKLRVSRKPDETALGEIIASVMNDSEPKEFEQDDWHVPYYHEGFWQPAGGTDKDLEGVTLEDARDISVGGIMLAVGYEGNAIEDKFFSLFEHQATVMGLRSVDIDEEYNFSFSEGVTHFDRKGKSWSANFVDWLQWRQMGSLYE